MISKVIRLAVTSFALLQLGCATTGSGFAHTDAEIELAQRQTENETLARLASSHNTDTADAASALARERVTR
jgi:hypothetical protein